MILLIFMKWSIDWDYRMYTATCFDGSTPQNVTCDSDSTTADMCPLDYGGSGDGCQPPNLISSLINIALSPGTVDEPMYAGQTSVQVCMYRMFKNSVRSGCISCTFGRCCLMSSLMSPDCNVHMPTCRGREIHVLGRKTYIVQVIQIFSPVPWGPSGSKGGR